MMRSVPVQLVGHHDAKDQRQWVWHAAIICTSYSNALPERLELADGLEGLWSLARQVQVDEEDESRRDEVAEFVASVAKEFETIVCDELTSARIHVKVEPVGWLLN